MKLFSTVLLLCLLVTTPVPLAAQDTDTDVQELGANLPGVNLHDLTLMVQKLTGRKFLWTEELGLRNKRVNFVAPDPIKGADNIFRVYQHFLQVNDLILVPAREPDEGEEPVYKIQLASVGPKRAVPFESEKVKPQDRFVSRLFHLNHVSPRDVHAALINMASYPQGILQIESAGILLITDYDYNVQRFERIIEEMDKPKPDIVLKRVVLKNALASEVEQIMNSLSQVILASSGGSTGGAVRGGRPSTSNKGEQLKIVADTRTNSVIVLAAFNRIDRIVEIVRELDSETGFETSGIYIRHLKHTDAIDIARTLNAMYKISIDESGVPSGGEGARPGEAVAPGGSGGASSSSSAGTALTGGEPTIVADVRSNSIIMITDRNTYKSLDEIITRLDSRRPQVLIKASVVEVRASDDFDFGMELARLSDPENRTELNGFSNFGYSTLTLPTDGSNDLGLIPAATTGLTLALMKDRIGNIGALVHASQGRAHITILDEPEVATVDNGYAEVKVSDEKPVVTSTFTSFGTPQVTFDRFETAETSLSISPHISEGGYLRLDLTVKIEKFTDEGSITETGVSIPPAKTSREITTNSILVPNGRTIVIGGIVTRDEQDSVAKVPFLGDIPLLGNLFRKTTQKSEKRTLYIFLTPYILYDNRWGDLKELTEERKFEIERLRRKALQRFQIDGPKDLQQRSTFRFSGPDDR